MHVQWNKQWCEQSGTVLEANQDIELFDRLSC
jgi:hypothetical protein